MSESKFKKWPLSKVPKAVRQWIDLTELEVVEVTRASEGNGFPHYCIDLKLPACLSVKAIMDEFPKDFRLYAVTLYLASCLNCLSFQFERKS